MCIRDRILEKRDLEIVMKSRKRRPLFIVDIAVPRDIETSVQEIPNVYLYTIDHLTEVINFNVGKRQQAAEAAEDYVLLGSETYQREKRVSSGNVLLKQYRRLVESIRQNELEKTKSAFDINSGTLDILDNFSQSLSNKLTHEITTLIRSAIAENKLELLEELKRLYRLESSNTRGSNSITKRNNEPF